MPFNLLPFSSLCWLRRQPTSTIQSTRASTLLNGVSQPQNGECAVVDDPPPQAGSFASVPPSSVPVSEVGAEESSTASPPVPTGTSLPRPCSDVPGESRAPPVSSPLRPKLKPKSRPAPTQPKRSYASEIHIEQATLSNPLPEGYMGTFRGIQYASPPTSCGAGSRMHKLTCGHLVQTPSVLPEEPCGINCASPSLNHAFDCLQCRNIVQSKLACLNSAERMQLDAVKQIDRALHVGMAMEFIARRSSPMDTQNIAATLVAVLDKARGRNTKASPGPAVQSLYAFVQDTQKEDERIAFVKTQTLVQHAKRRYSQDIDEAAAGFLAPTQEDKKRKIRIQHASINNEIKRTVKRKADAPPQIESDTDSDDTITAGISSSPLKRAKQTKSRAAFNKATHSRFSRSSYIPANDFSPTRPTNVDRANDAYLEENEAYSRHPALKRKAVDVFTENAIDFQTGIDLDTTPSRAKRARTPEQMLNGGAMRSPYFTKKRL